MGQILHGSATTTHAIRAAIQRSKAPLKELAARYGLNPKTVAKWRKRAFVHDARDGSEGGPLHRAAAEEEAMVVAFRKHTLLPLDDCLYALQATIPHLTRSSLHRCLQRHGISRLPEIDGDKPPNSRSRPTRSATSISTSPRSAPSRASSTCSSPSTGPRKFAFAQLHDAPRSTAADFLRSPDRLPCPTRSTPFSPTTASSSAICRNIDRRRQRDTGCTASSAFAGNMMSNIV